MNRCTGCVTPHGGKTRTPATPGTAPRSWHRCGTSRSACSISPGSPRSSAPSRPSAVTGPACSPTSRYETQTTSSSLTTLPIPWSHPGITGERKTGRVNDTELSLTSRDCGSSPVGNGGRGAGAGRWKAADAGQDKPFWPGGHHRPRDKESTHPGRISCARNTETLAGVQDGTMLIRVGRPQGKRRSPAGQDGPGSERRPPKGSRKPGKPVADLQRFPA